jgi:uncharacterized membrane protein YqjE
VAQQVPIDPDRGVTDLVRQLGSDSKRLAGDEVRLAKLEAVEALHRAGRGALWLGIALGVAVVALVALTLFVATVVGRIANGHMWVGALVAAVIEIPAGLWLLRAGLNEFKDAPYTLPDTRGALTLADD